MKTRFLLSSIMAAALATLAVGAQAQQFNPRGDMDRDGIENRYDNDRDGDGVANKSDIQPNVWNPSRVVRAPDMDGDGIADHSDRDRDGDGIANARDPRPNIPDRRHARGEGRGDRDHDRYGNRRDRDRDDDGVANRRDRDMDGDGVVNWNDDFPRDPNRS